VTLTLLARSLAPMYVLYVWSQTLFLLSRQRKLRCLVCMLRWLLRPFGPCFVWLQHAHPLLAPCLVQLRAVNPAGTISSEQFSDARLKLFTEVAKSSVRLVHTRHTRARTHTLCCVVLLFVPPFVAHANGRTLCEVTNRFVFCSLCFLLLQTKGFTQVFCSADFCVGVRRACWFCFFFFFVGGFLFRHTTTHTLDARCPWPMCA